jgi:hypothetical protein
MDGDVAFALEPWHDLWVMVGGAAGALTGLLFVAVSINVDRIIAGRDLPRRAVETLLVLVTILVLAVLGLAPQGVRALAVEAGVLGVIVLVVTVNRLGLPSAPGGRRLWHMVPAVVLAAFGVPLLAGGISLFVGGGGGLYWLVGALVLGLAGAVLNAWVLLVEILR